jgi:anthranilate synthase component 1
MEQMEVGPGERRQLVRERVGAVDPLALFRALSADGRAPHAVLLESSDIHHRTAERSLGCADPCLRIAYRQGAWRMEALNRTGAKVLRVVEPRLGFAVELCRASGAGGLPVLTGRLPPPPRSGTEERSRLRAVGPMDLLRVVHGAFRPVGPERFPAGGLLGIFAYDLIDCFEELPREQEDPHPVPDFVFYLADNMFLVDHLRDRCLFTATVLGVEDVAEELALARERLARFEALASSVVEDGGPPAAPRIPGTAVAVDLDDEEYAAVVRELKERILAGDIFQVVPSRSFRVPVSEPPLAVYRRLRVLNPSPYMFFVRLGEETLLGASPETALRVTAATRRVEIRPIAGTRPRGLVAGQVDADLDARYEAELKLDRKEQAEHMMLVDLARNDVARVSEPGTRRVDRLLTVEKYSHVQHLVSHVSGVLRGDLDALHAYLATMNMGTLTGAPKVEAMRLLRQAERTRRGFYGGGVGYYMFNGDFDTAIVIRSILFHSGEAVVRAGAGIVHDSIPHREAEETRAKARAPLAALGVEGLR